jgi:hypothetical protein
VKNAQPPACLYHAAREAATLLAGLIPQSRWTLGERRQPGDCGWIDRNTVDAAGDPRIAILVGITVKV